MGAEERGRVDALMSRPMAVIGAGTLGPRIALMLATRGGEVRIFARTPERCQAAKTFVEVGRRHWLPKVVLIARIEFAFSTLYRSRFA